LVAHVSVSAGLLIVAALKKRRDKKNR